MSGVPFSWMWGDPAEVMDRLRPLKAAKARELKGQR